MQRVKKVRLLDLLDVTVFAPHLLLSCLNAVSLFQLKGKINMGHSVPLKSLVEKLSPTESMCWFSLNAAFKLTVMTVMNN